MSNKRTKNLVTLKN